MKKIVYNGQQLSITLNRKRKVKKGASCMPCIILMGVFPTRQSDKNDYYNNALAYLTPTATQTRLRIVAGKFTTFSGLIGGPVSPTATPPNTNGTAGTWNYNYPLTANKATTTNPLRTGKDNLIVSIEAALKDLFSDIPDSVITTLDTLNLGIKPKSDRKKAKLTPELITALVVIGLKALGGSNVEVKCRTNTDTKKASKLNENCDIEYAYSLVEKGEKVPETADECTFIKQVTKARTVLPLGADAVGKKLVLFSRWIYSKHPAQSGSFGSAVTIVVS